MRAFPSVPGQGVVSPVGLPLPHESAHLHVTGQATYVDDLAEVSGTLHVALGWSPVAHGRLLGIDRDRLMAQAGVVAVMTAADIPGANQCGPIVPDDPILAAGTVQYLGQPVFAVVATDRRLALRAAAIAADVIRVEPLPAVLTARQAYELGEAVVPPMLLRRGDAAAAIAAAPHRLSGTQIIGGQEQFYLEGQISYALPQEDRGLKVHCSTQHPSEMQHLVAHALGLGSNQVQVECRRMGGGFGGKESQSALFACVAALAAQRLGKPVKLRVDRDDDFMITGRRHPFEVDWEVGFDDQGQLLGARALFISNAGCSADLSAPVMTRALCHFDNAYYLPEVDLQGFCARTNTQSNTAFRGFGGPQGALVMEAILDDVARHLGLDPLRVRRANLYSRTPQDGRNTTPYGQVVEDNILPDLIDELVRSSGYEQRRSDIATFNRASPVVKRGLALTPVKFGISFNLAHLNQAGALVHIYTDGTVLVNHGGTEMGQGLNTKVAQVVAQELGVALHRVRVTATDTHKVANTSATAASTGSDLNGKAAQDAARTLAQRLVQHWAQREGVDPQRVRLTDDGLLIAHKRLSFEEAVAGAYVGRVQLWSDGFYATPGLHWDRNTMTGKPFYYFAYGAAVSEVLLDTLTGESRVVGTDILHDVGASLNPALDIGQIEGGFIQGMGWMTMEELWWHPQSGRLMTHAPSTYKIPCANDIPPRWRVELFGRPNGADSIHRSKAVGEPPLLLSFSVLMALRDAVSACAPDTRPATQIRLAVPATPESVLHALQDVRTAHTPKP
ncbi:MAG: xanthine dehydrogenase molybdopterin binding subunit [Betaproteobacteria bacterium]|nr:xanthine dehydrogenase molybdopterin binding subunit [Betaproteobacteria bacterium]